MSTDTSHPEKGTGEASPHEYTDLTKFQTRILAVIGAADGAPKGIAVKHALADYYAREVHHGQVYPNLATLVKRGLLVKGSKDRRTNEYRLTDRGRAVLRRETDWFVDHAHAADLDEEPAVRADGGLPQHLTPTNTLDGGTIYRCTRCGCEGETVVSHLDGCPAADGDEEVQPIVTDGGVIGAQVDDWPAPPVGECLIGETVVTRREGEPRRIAVEVRHPEDGAGLAPITVFYDVVRETAVFDCADLPDERFHHWGVQLIAAADRAARQLPVVEAVDHPEPDREGEQEIATDGGVQVRHVDRAQELVDAAQRHLAGTPGPEDIAAARQRLDAADEELNAAQVARQNEP